MPKKYVQGTAPYPQQDWGEQPNPHEPAATPVPPQQPGYVYASSLHVQNLHMPSFSPRMGIFDLNLTKLTLL